MRRAQVPRHTWLLRLASVALLGVPVAFGVIRALATGNDFRYLWLAGAAIVGSLAVAFGGGTPFRGPFPIGRTLLSVVAGAACATAVALLMGTTAGLGIAVVALSFGVCTGAGAVLAALTPPRLPL
jgi:hypothetical protein